MNGKMWDDLATLPTSDTSNEWYTPGVSIEAARTVMGAIDLDPASCALANQTVKATHYYTKEENGLAHPWYGRVWCNPPYTQVVPGHSSIKAWVKRAHHLYQEGTIEQCILLIPNDTSTTWFEWLWAYPVCFPPKRIKFLIPGKKKAEQPTFGTCFVYLGPSVQAFIDTFTRFGPVVRRVSPSPSASLPTLWSQTSEEVSA